jgi:hypothetical protein
MIVSFQFQGNFLRTHCLILIMNRFCAAFVSFFLASSAWGQDPAPKTEAPDPGFEIKSMKCFSDKIINKAEIGKTGIKVEGGFRIGTPAGPGSELNDFTFPEDQLKQFFEFQFGPGSAGKTIGVTVKAMRTTLGTNLPVVEVSGKTDATGKLPAEWSLKKNWPVGLYKVFFTCDGAPVGTAGYLVKAVQDRESPIKATGVSILSFKDGKSTEKTKLAPTDNDLIFKCATRGASTKGAEVRMFVGKREQEGKNTIIKGSEVTVADWPLEDTEIIYSLELPDKFPKGNYDMVIFVNGKLLIEHPFSVADGE